MNRELITEYEDPLYPVLIDFVEADYKDWVSEWVVRKNDIEIMVVNYGSFNIEMENASYTVTAGQGVLINAGTPHKVSINHRESISYYTLVFSPYFLFTADFRKSLYEKYGLTDTASDFFRCVVLDESNLRDESALDKINTIIAINHTRKIGYEMMTKGHLCLLWVSFLNLIKTGEETYNSKNLPTQDELRVRAAAAYIKEFYQDNITLSDIADKIHVSRNECCRCFKRVLGISPVDYLIRLRIYHAARIIYKDPTAYDSISDIAFSVGFNSASYFNKMFKRYLQCTPSEFFKQLKVNAAEVTGLYESLEEAVKNI